MSYSSLLPQFAEILAYGVTFMIAIQTFVTFYKRAERRAVPLNMTALFASAISMFYSVYGLVYWFAGGQYFDCTWLQIVLGTCMSMSNALCFAHLFLKAETANKASIQWKYWRLLGMGTTLFNWVTLFLVHALLTGTSVDGVDGNRCAFKFEMTSFRLKWIGQIVNQIFQAIAFVYPLYTHSRAMSSSSSASSSTSSSKTTTYDELVRRAIIATVVSVTVTIAVTITVFVKIDYKIKSIPVFPLAVADNGFNLLAILYAINVSTGKTGITANQNTVSSAAAMSNRNLLKSTKVSTVAWKPDQVSDFEMEEEDPAVRVRPITSASMNLNTIDASPRREFATEEQNEHY